MKKTFVNPSVKVTRFHQCDIITTSGSKGVGEGENTTGKDSIDNSDDIL